MSVLQGRYEIVRRIGTGGFAEALLARVTGTVTPQYRVIKRILPHLVENPEFVKMFRDEARIAGLLHHPNVVSLHESGVFEGTPYMVLEYVEGVTLAAMMTYLADNKKAIPVNAAAMITAWACRGLHHAHDATDERGATLGLVHRDVSPQNVMVSRRGEVKILDFGIAKTSQQSVMTKTGVLKGKLGYLAPEYCIGQEVDRRADVYAMGVTLHEMLTGAPLFTDTNPALAIRRITSETLQPPSRLNPAVPQILDTIVMNAIHRDPTKRIPDARSFADQLERAGYSLKWQMTPESLANYLQKDANDILPDVSRLTPKPQPPSPLEASIRQAGTVAERHPTLAPRVDPPVVMGAVIGVPVKVLAGTPVHPQAVATMPATQVVMPPVAMPMPSTPNPPVRPVTPTSDENVVPEEWVQVASLVTEPEGVVGHPDMLCPVLRDALGFRSELNQMFADIYERYQVKDEDTSSAAAKVLRNGTRAWKRTLEEDPFRPRGEGKDVRGLNRTFYARLFSADGLGGRIKGGGRRFVSWGPSDRDWSRAGVETSDGQWLPFLHVSSMGRVLSLVHELGGRVIQPEANVREGAYAIIQDPMGGTLGLLIPANRPPSMVGMR